MGIFFEVTFGAEFLNKSDGRVGEGIGNPDSAEFCSGGKGGVGKLGKRVETKRNGTSREDPRCPGVSRREGEGRGDDVTLPTLLGFDRLIGK